MKSGSGKMIRDKSESVWRWAILVLGCFMMVGSYYCFDIPAALKTQIDDYMGDPSDYELSFGLLYTLYSAPNVRESCDNSPILRIFSLKYISLFVNKL